MSELPTDALFLFTFVFKQALKQATKLFYLLVPMCCKFDLRQSAQQAYKGET